MTEIEFRIADDNEPGFLRRVMEARKFLDHLHDEGVSIEYYEKLVDFLLKFVRVPEDRDEAREALLDCSKDQYQELLNAVITGKANPTSPEGTGTS